VWLVTDDAYEGHEVVAAFGNSEAAEACAKELNRGRTGSFQVPARVGTQLNAKASSPRNSSPA
jgi:hypothetical protein